MPLLSHLLGIPLHLHCHRFYHRRLRLCRCQPVQVLRQLCRLPVDHPCFHHRCCRPLVRSHLRLRRHPLVCAHLLRRLFRPPLCPLMLPKTLKLLRMCHPSHSPSGLRRKRQKGLDLPRAIETCHLKVKNSKSSKTHGLVALFATGLEVVDALLCRVSVGVAMILGIIES